jgi:hypothetical protein
VGDADAPAGLLGDAPRREGGVVAADGDQVGHPELVEGAHHRREVRGIARRVGARGLQDRAAEQMDARHRPDAQLEDPAGVPLHDALEALDDPEDARALAPRENRGGADDAVDAGGGPPSHQDAERRHR